MNQKILELESILEMISNAPKVKRSNLSFIEQAHPIQQEIKPEGASFIIQENIDHLKTIKELKEKIMSLENTVNDQKCQINYLNTLNYKLKTNEKSLKDNLLRIKGSIRVICRIRPTEKHCAIKYDETSICIDEKVYSLDHVYNTKCTQQEVYDEIKPEIEAVMEGYNICVFAFGQTGSGKTFTMSGNDENEGLIFKSINEFKMISDSLRLQGYSVKFTVKYLEVYNENVKDLFTNGNVTIFHDSNGITLKNCTSEEFTHIGQAYDLLKRTVSNRKIGETNCNLNSSRSHALFIISVDITGNNETRHGSLCLIDLAGSERLSESKAENERLKETQFINKSLSALGNVIVSLKRKDQHIPFRDSKLTHLMQEYFTGKSRTSMIVHINPESLNESTCSLRFATKVSECTMKVANKDVTKYL